MVYTASVLQDFSLQCLLGLLSLGSFSGFNIGFVKCWLILGPSDVVVRFNKTKSRSAKPLRLKRNVSFSLKKYNDTPDLIKRDRVKRSSSQTEVGLPLHLALLDCTC